MGFFNTIGTTAGMILGMVTGASSQQTQIQDAVLQDPLQNPALMEPFLGNWKVNSITCNGVASENLAILYSGQMEMTCEVAANTFTFEVTGNPFEWIPQEPPFQSGSFRPFRKTTTHPYRAVAVDSITGATGADDENLSWHSPSVTIQLDKRMQASGETTDTGTYHFTLVSSVDPFFHEELTLTSTDSKICTQNSVGASNPVRIYLSR